MKLNREEKRGTIKDINLAKAAVAITLSVGLVTVGWSMLDLNMKNNLSKTDKYSSYSEQVESVFDVDITSQDKKDILNGMEECLDLVDQYRVTEDSSKKGEIFDQICDRKDKLKADALYLIKIDAALEDGKNPSEYRIRPGSDSEWEVYREEDGMTKYFSPLNRQARRLVNTSVALEDTSKEDSERLVKLFEDTVKQSAAYVGKTAEKSGKAL